MVEAIQLRTIKERIFPGISTFENICNDFANVN